MAGPSIWPFAVAVSLAVASVAELLDQWWLLGVSLLATAVFVVLWLWPDAEQIKASKTEEGRHVHGLPRFVQGTRAIGWWGMFFTVVVLTACLGSVYYGYFYLRTTVADWPPAGFAIPDAVLPLIGAALLIAAIPPAFWSNQSIQRDRQGQTQIGIALAIIFGVAFEALIAWYILGLPFSAQAHAYGSLVYTLLWFHALVALLGLVMSGTVLLQALLGHFNQWRYLAVQNVFMYWSFVAVAWIPTVFVLCFSPYLT